MPQKMSSFQIPLKIGILGGGQLARMLALKAHQLGLEPHVLSAHRQDPAAQVSLFWHPGDPHNPLDLRDFMKNVDLITFESEFIDGKILQDLQKEIQISFYPEASSLQLLQDRWTQKRALSEASLPTSSFLLVNDQKSFETSCKYFNNRVVFKKRQGGYDGNGTFILKSSKDRKTVQAQLEKIDYQVIAEEFVPFQRELACVFARNPAGEVFALPLVESFQENSRCSWVIGPVQHRAWPGLQKKIKHWMKNLNYVGVLAFELFDCKGKLLINETAPRVHNSGHYSMNALAVDQFELHLRCLLNWPLPKENTFLSKDFSMINLLGKSSNPVQFPKDLQGHLHWYGKKDNRPGRKMGHLNFLGSDKKKLLRLGLKERKRIIL